ncbi:type IV pilus biogenesis protein PilM [Hippea alviniae]|uniref:type IV pilus biogenesis protein PilM n=1 Tax=Hippea alviniae TaxID=1279027 RepID=UPI0003B6E704|nr:type IV pilus assembly protein PilM [Hippea alviniae]
MLGLSKSGVVGVDIGHYYTKVVNVIDKKGVLVLKQAFRELTPQDVITSEGVDDVVLGDFLRSIFSQHGLKSKNVSVALNSSFVITKTLSIPLVADEEIEQAVMWEAEQYAPVSMEDVNVSYQILDKNEDKNEMTVLLALTKKEIVDSYIKAFSRAKLKVSTVDVDVFAIYNSFEANNKEALNKHLLFVDMGYSSTKLIFVKKGIPIFTRYMDFNFSSLIEDAVGILSLKKEEISILLERKHNDEKKESLLNFLNDKLISLFTQIQNSMTFYLSNILNVEEPVEEVVLTGILGALYESLNIDMMREFFKSDISRYNPFDVVSKDESGEAIEETTPDVSPFYCIASGLALRSIVK